LDYDGHGTFSPDGKWMITDTYPDNKFHEQKLFLMDMKTQAVLPLGRFVEPPEFTGGWRCTYSAESGHPFRKLTDTFLEKYFHVNLKKILLISQKFSH